MPARVIVAEPAAAARTKLVWLCRLPPAPA
jgi:hypothetical protein